MPRQFKRGNISPQHIRAEQGFGLNWHGCLSVLSWSRMRRIVTFLTLFNVESTPTQEESTILYQGSIAGLTFALMVSAEADGGRIRPGGRAGLQNRIAWRKLRGWFTSIPSPPSPLACQECPVFSAQCRRVSASISATRSSVRAEIFLTSKSICPMSRNIVWDS